MRVLVVEDDRDLNRQLVSALTDAGYCQRIWLPKRGPRGSAPAVYTLARRGINRLRAEGFEINLRYHPSEKSELSYLFLTHTLELNDFFMWSMGRVVAGNCIHSAIGERGQ